MSAITPELALVDPEVAAVARALLPEPGAFLPAWISTGVNRGTPPRPALTLPATPESVPPKRRRTRRRAALAVVGVLTGVAAALALTVTHSAIPGTNATVSGTGIEDAATSLATARHSRAGRTYAWPDVGSRSCKADARSSRRRRRSRLSSFPQLWSFLRAVTRCPQRHSQRARYVSRLVAL
jgi:hypothetical protein